MERNWIKTPNGEEHEFAFSRGKSYATGQKRIPLADGQYRYFTILDDPAALDVSVDDIPELIPDELEDVFEKRDSIPIITDDNGYKL